MHYKVSECDEAEKDMVALQQIKQQETEVKVDPNFGKVPENAEAFKPVSFKRKY